MKVCTPEIVWHSKEPVFTADFHSRGGQTWRLATGGADNDVRVWKVVCSEGHGVKIVFMSTLSRHSKAVNVVRFSPSGHLLASAGDDAVVCLWQLSEGAVGGNIEGGGETANKENWTVIKILRGHLEDIYDLCWSQRSEFIVTGSVDNSAIVWDVQKGQLLSVLKESSHYVQGVAWDPHEHYIATVSSDRNLRVYSAEGKNKCLHSVSKLSIPDKSGGVRQFKMWVDEGLSSFFRRLSFTPDGSLLIVPAGRFEEGEKIVKNTTYIFARNNLTKPVIQLPGTDKATVVVRCCPILFQLRPPPPSSSSSSSQPPLINLPYRMVFAVASMDSVLLYDTQHSVPFAFVSNIHYTGITDLTWSSDGCILLVTSSDGYCSLVTFEPGELGVPLPLEQVPDVIGQSKPGEEREKNGIHSPPSPSLQVVSTTPELQPNDIKPRRIRPTIISSFTTTTTTTTTTPPTAENKPSTAASNQTQDCKNEEEEEGNNCTTTMDVAPSTSTAAEPVLASTADAVEQSVLATGGGEQKKARRVNLITLTTFPSCSSPAAECTKTADSSCSIASCAPPLSSGADERGQLGGDEEMEV